MVQAGTFAIVALGLGIPVGVAAGRALWEVAADQIGTFAGPSVPMRLLLLEIGIALGAAIALAAWPGRTAARTPASAVLRAE